MPIDFKANRSASNSKRAGSTPTRLRSKSFHSKPIQVTVSSGQTTGSAAHNLSGNLYASPPNPDVEDGANNGARASISGNNVTVTTPVPTSQDIVYTVLVTQYEN